MKKTINEDLNLNPVVKTAGFNNDKEKNNFFKKYWYLILIGVILILGAIYFYLNREPNNIKSPDNTSIKSKYFIYADKDGFMNITDTEKEELNTFELVGTYECKSKACTYENYVGDFILFDDKVLTIYNYKTKKSSTVNISRKDFFYLELVGNESTLYGILLSGENKSTYYSLELNKTIVTTTGKEDSIAYNAEYGYLSIVTYNEKTDSYTSKAINYQGKEFIPQKDKLKKLENSNLYYYEVGYNETGYLFFDNEMKPLFEGREATQFLLKDNNLVILNKDNSKFEIYDENATLIKSSESYKRVYNLVDNNYAVVIDSKNYLKVVDLDDNVLASFTEINDKYVYQPMISGWYEENNKEGIYLIVEDKTIPKNDDDVGQGYEYYYIPSTSETGKIAIEIDGYAKPVLYLYPKENDTKVNVTFAKPYLLTTTYPKFNKNWSVLANKNGDLYDKNNKYYYGLYWEEVGSTKVDFSTGFYVTKDSAIKFLEEKLNILGLNPKERNEFIMYWLPILEKSLVYFETTLERQQFNELIIEPKPDSLLRIAIHVKKVTQKEQIKEQTLPTFNRVGFTAIEWGGVIHK